MLSKALNACTDVKSHIQKVYTYLALVDVYLSMERKTGPILAIDPLLSCMTLAKQFSLNMVLNMALVRFAHVLLHLGYTFQSRHMLRRIMPDILANGDLMTQAYAQFLFAQALLVTLPKAEWDQAIKSMIDAKSCYAKQYALAESKTVIRTLSSVYNTLELCEQRNACAREYRELSFGNACSWEKFINS
jgi:hypothetical protein